MNEESTNGVAVVFNGFLALSMKEKVSLVNILNEFFDYPDRREEIRKQNEDRVTALKVDSSDGPCKCCRR